MSNINSVTTNIQYVKLYGYKDNKTIQIPVLSSQKFDSQKALDQHIERLVSKDQKLDEELQALKSIQDQVLPLMKEIEQLQHDPQDFLLSLNDKIKQYQIIDFTKPTSNFTDVTLKINSIARGDQWATQLLNEKTQIVSSTASEAQLKPGTLTISNKNKDNILSIVLEDGDTMADVVKKINDKNGEIKAVQNHDFYDPQDKSALILTSNLIGDHNLILKIDDVVEKNFFTHTTSTSADIEVEYNDANGNYHKAKPKCLDNKILLPNGLTVLLKKVTPKVEVIAFDNIFDAVVSNKEKVFNAFDKIRSITSDNFKKIDSLDLITVYNNSRYVLQDLKVKMLNIIRTYDIEQYTNFLKADVKTQHKFFTFNAVKFKNALQANPHNIINTLYKSFYEPTRSLSLKDPNNVYSVHTNIQNSVFNIHKDKAYVISNLSKAVSLTDSLVSSDINDNNSIPAGNVQFGVFTISLKAGDTLLKIQDAINEYSSHSNIYAEIIKSSNGKKGILRLKPFPQANSISKIDLNKRLSQGTLGVLDNLFQPEPDTQTINGFITAAATNSVVIANDNQTVCNKLLAGTFIINGQKIELKEGDTMANVYTKISKAVGNDVKITFDKDAFLNSYKMTFKSTHSSTKKTDFTIEDKDGVFAGVGGLGVISRYQNFDPVQLDALNEIRIYNTMNVANIAIATNDGKEIKDAAFILTDPKNLHSQAEIIPINILGQNGRKEDISVIYTNNHKELKSELKVTMGMAYLVDSTILMNNMFKGIEEKLQIEVKKLDEKKSKNMKEIIKMQDKQILKIQSQQQEIIKNAREIERIKRDKDEWNKIRGMK